MFFVVVVFFFPLLKASGLRGRVRVRTCSLENHNCSAAIIPTFQYPVYVGAPDFLLLNLLLMQWHFQSDSGREESAGCNMPPLKEMCSYAELITEARPMTLYTRELLTSGFPSEGAHSPSCHGGGPRCSWGQCCSAQCHNVT